MKKKRVGGIKNMITKKIQNIGPLKEMTEFFTQKETKQKIHLV